jgi:hypothetical protein
MGNGELLEDAKALVKKLDIEDMVWSGLTRYATCFKCHDIYTLPSLWEGLPIGLLKQWQWQNLLLPQA